MAKDKNKSEKTEIPSEVIKTVETNESAETVEVNTVNYENNGISTIPVDEFNDRLKSALEKHLPEEGINNYREARVFVQFVGRQIGNNFEDMPTGIVVNLVGLMVEGKYQNDKMLKLIEDMPIGGYSY